MDPQDNRPADELPVPDAQDTADATAPDAASPPPRESRPNGLMNRFLRGLGLGRDDDASADETPETEPAAEPPAPTPTTPEPERLTMTAEEFRRAVQSAKDRELVQERRAFAAQQADAGDLGPIRALAEKGDSWARHQLAERGDTWALGEIAQAEEIARAKAAEDPVPAIATSFDQTVIWPLLAALPEAEERRIVGSGIVGMAGRAKAVEDSIGVLRREAVAAALTDEKFVSSLLRSQSFREALLKTPAANKQFRSYFRGDRDEPDHVPAVASSRRRENDFMNDLLRGGSGSYADDDE